MGIAATAGRISGGRPAMQDGEDQIAQDRRTAMYAGVWFLATIVFSIPGYLMYGDALDRADYVVGAGSANVRLAAFLEILTAIAGIATAVVLYRIVRRVRESVAIGYVALRVVESTTIVVGLVAMLSLMTMRQQFADGSGGDAAFTVGLGRSLLALHDWTFIIGPAFCAGLGNGIMLGYLLYRGELVPRGWAMLGMIGGTIAFVSATCQLFGVFENGSTPSQILIVPEFVWELFVGIYLTFWGFRRTGILTEPAAATS